METMWSILVIFLGFLLLFALYNRRDRDRSVRETFPGPINDVREGYQYANRAAQQLDPGSCLQSVELQCGYKNGDIHISELSYAFYRQVFPRWRKSRVYYRCWHVTLENVTKRLRGWGPGIFGPRHTRELKATSDGAWPGQLSLDDITVSAREAVNILLQTTSGIEPLALDNTSLILVLTPCLNDKPVWTAHWQYTDQSVRFTVIDARTGSIQQNSHDALFLSESGEKELRDP